MMENIIKAARPEEPLMETEFNIASNPFFNNHLLKGEDIDTISEEDLYKILKESYTSILQGVFSKNKSDRQYINMFKSRKFMTALIKVLHNSQTPFTIEQKVYCNKLAYDYMTLPDANDHFLNELFFTMSKVVNRDVMPSLLAVGFDENAAANLALARYSSFNETINILRLNMVLLSMDPDTVDPSKIVKVYGKLFDHLGILFETVMFNVNNIGDGDDESELSQDLIDMMEMDGNITLAILDILSSQPIDIIAAVLRGYGNSFMMLHSGDPAQVRTSLRNLSADYERITYVINMLAQEVYIP